MLGALAATAFLPWASACRRGAPRPPAPPEIEPAAEPAEAQRDLAEVAVRRLRLPAAEPVMRVRVHRAPQGAVRVGAPTQWLRVSAAEGAQAEVAQGPLSLRRWDGAWHLEPPGAPARALGWPGPLRIQSIDPRHAVVAIEDREHPGDLVLVGRGDGEAFDVINHVGLEAYLPGVVGRELFRGWHEHAFLAQAVAARSFAAAEHAYFRDRRHYDLTNTAHSQVYGGHETLREAVDAVARTRGEMLDHEGFLVPGYYSSCCGGLPARAIDAIGTNPVNRTPPLDGRGIDEACVEAPLYRWHAEQPVEHLQRRLAAYGRQTARGDLTELGPLAGIRADELNPHGRPVTYLLFDESGASAGLTAGRLRDVAHLEIDGVGRPEERLHSAFVDVRIEAGRVHFEGHGFGHGVGMCQYGAQARAKGGQGYSEILEWYYPGAAVRAAYR